MGVPGLAPFAAMGLFLGGMGAAFGAYVLLGRGNGLRRRAAGIALAVSAFGSFAVATAMPVIIHASPTLARPSTAARLTFASPRPDELVRGAPAQIAVRLSLQGGKVVPFTSLHLVPGEGHIHLYLDGRLVAMTGLEGYITAPSGRHTLSAEFVAVDHGPFQPRVLARVTFEVRP